VGPYIGAPFAASLANEPLLDIGQPHIEKMMISRSAPRPERISPKVIFTERAMPHDSAAAGSVQIVKLLWVGAGKSHCHSCP
jgi:hypothetical protein